ncbi:protein of unknown function [Agrobacterium pusense]|uniref:Uncharacterized protein n=1 Tax=Agrobacterium pusense TaxID=648995 RepID=U4PYX2_9HYPH|nr:protein of unknown function [Agrobacterium pusense]
MQAFRGCRKAAQSGSPEKGFEESGIHGSIFSDGCAIQLQVSGVVSPLASVVQEAVCPMGAPISK